MDVARNCAVEANAELAIVMLAGLSGRIAPVSPFCKMAGQLQAFIQELAETAGVSFERCRRQQACARTPLQHESTNAAAATGANDPSASRSESQTGNTRRNRP